MLLILFLVCNIVHLKNIYSGKNCAQYNCILRRGQQRQRTILGRENGTP